MWDNKRERKGGMWFFLCIIIYGVFVKFIVINYVSVMVLCGLIVRI